MLSLGSSTQNQRKSPQPLMMDRVCPSFGSVDDLKEGRGAEYIDISSIVLVFCSVNPFFLCLVYLLHRVRPVPFQSPGVLPFHDFLSS